MATTATEEDWIDKARRCTTDQLEHQVQAVREPRIGERRVLLPSVTHRVYGKLQDLLAELRAQVGRPHLDDEAGFEELLDLAARALGRDDIAQNAKCAQRAQEDESSTAAVQPSYSASGDSTALEHRIAELARSARPTYSPPDPNLDPHPDSRSIPWQHKRNLLRRAGHACEHCGNTLALELHHRVHHEDGGTRSPQNLQVTCRRCHEATHELVRRRAPTPTVAGTT